MRALEPQALDWQMFNIHDPGLPSKFFPLLPILFEVIASRL